MIKVNGSNVATETHEDVFYRIKACENVVTLMAVDAKTFLYCQRNDIDLRAKTAEWSFFETKRNAGNV